MKYKSQNYRGFSIIEIIIYLSIFTILSILVINSFITVMRSFSATRENISLLEAGINGMERISREIRKSDAIDLVNSSLSEGILHLNNTKDGFVKRFSSESGDLNLYECSSLGACDILSGNLIGENISLESLVFRRIITEKSEAIKIEMSLRDVRSKTGKVENFYNTIILRGGY